MRCSDISTRTSILSAIIMQRHGRLILRRYIHALRLALSEILRGRCHHGVLAHASSPLHHHDQGDEDDHEGHDHNVADDAAGAAGEMEAEDAVEKSD